jgi:hypothetical protein
VDAFSEVLSTVKLQGALFFNAEFSEPWGFQSPHSSSLIPLLLPDAEHLVIYHFVLEGSAHIQADSGETVSLDAGDIVVFPHGDPHSMGCGTPDQVMETSATLKRLLPRNVDPLRAGGGGSVTRFVCGFMACDPRLCGPFLAGLPKMFKVNIPSDASGRWIENSIRHLADEAATAAPGSSAMLAKLSEALFAISPVFLQSRPGGWPEPAMPPSARAWPSCTAARSIPGPSPSWPAKSVCRAPRWWSASRATWPSPP